MNWGNKIIVAFFLFTAMVVTMVVIAMKHDVGLVANDYYKDEIAYQQQIDRMTNYSQLTEKPQFKLKKNLNRIEVSFPEELLSDDLVGAYVFFRPSTNKLDREVAVRLDQFGKQNIDISNFAPGRWKLKLSWKHKQKEYFNEIAMTF